MDKIKFNRIKEVLENRGLNQSWLADEVGISANALSSICTNKSQPKLPTLFKIASKLEVGISELLISTNPFDEQDLVLNRISEVMSENGQEANLLIENLGLSENTISDISTNRIQPTLRQLYKIAAILEVDVCELLRKENPFVTDTETTTVES